MLKRRCDRELNAGAESARLKWNLPEVEHGKGTRPRGGAMGRGEQS